MGTISKHVPEAHLLAEENVLSLTNLVETCGRLRSFLGFGYKYLSYLSIPAEDLELGHGTGITVISDSHKELLYVVSDWLPNVERRKCTRHNKANHHNARRHKALYYSKIGRDEQKGMCKLWELSGIPCVHSVATYVFLNKVPDEGVDHWYSQERWFEAYQFSIKLIYGSNMWKKQPNKPLLPLIVVRMPGRPRKNRVKAKRNCDKEQLPKPPQMKKQPSRKREPNFNSYASNRGGGRGSREGGGEASGGIGQSNAVRFQANTERGESSGGRGRARGKGGRSGMARGRGSRGQGECGRGRGRGVTTMLVDEEAIQEEFDEEAVRLTLEEESRYEKEYQDKIREDEESKYNQMWYNHGITLPKSASTRVECGTTYVQTQESIVDRGEPGWRLNEDAPTVEPIVLADPSVAATRKEEKSGRAKAFKRVNTFEDFRTEVVEGKEKRAGTELAQEITKKQKVEDNKETTELKKLIEIFPDEEEKCNGGRSSSSLNEVAFFLAAAAEEKKKKHMVPSFLTMEWSKLLGKLL
ncbi:hypothetical protein Tco_1135319 [Tanacetum coccineum]